MAKTKVAKEPTVSGKKLNRLLIEQSLENALAGLKPVIGKKKFDRRIRKAGKLLYNGFPKKAVDSWRKVKITDKQLSEVKDQMQPAISNLP